jgi:hypothetical protein
MLNNFEQIEMLKKIPKSKYAYNKERVRDVKIGKKVKVRKLWKCYF